MLDVNTLFARAEQAFLAGQLETARKHLVTVTSIAGDHPTVLHLLALVEKRSGNFDAARRAFETASRLAPKDPQIESNFANLLAEMGEQEEALRRYGIAIAANPNFAEARYNRALLLQKLGRVEEALVDLDAAGAVAPAAKIDSARGIALRTLRRFDEAARAFEAALQKEPKRVTALHGRARIAMERGEDCASSLYRRALAARPDDPDLKLGLAEALEAEGQPEGLTLLRDAVEQKPGWIEGHEALARMRSEAGETDGFADHYLNSIAKRPNDPDLYHSYIATLARGERYEEALATLARAERILPASSDLRLLKATLTSEAGEPEAALELLDQLGDSASHPDLEFSRGRIALRAGEHRMAAAALERDVQANPAAIRSWAHLDLAWRLVGDPRHEWLSCQPNLCESKSLGLSRAELGSIAELLRSIHRTHAHPIGQSLRGGTQTRGDLFQRKEPEIARLRDAVEQAVHDYVDGLPPRDEAHPLLRHRDAPLEIVGSWSIRLSGEGFHINHIHPEGLLSSASYISLPPTIQAAPDRSGWLELGRPPQELQLRLEPLFSIEPKEGETALFPSYLFHGTRPFPAGERLTAAFDVAVR